MEKTYKLLIVSSLVAICQGNSHGNGGDVYGANAEKRSFSQAHDDCQAYGFKYLAQINNVEKLARAKNISVNRQSGKYWMGLQVYNSGTWRWSTGKHISMGPEFQKILNHTFAEEESATKGHDYCFLVTNRTKLEMANCSQKHPYICEGSPGIVNPSTPVILHSTPAMTTETTVTDTTKIIPTKTSFYTWRTSSKVSGKIIPTKTTTYTSSTSSKVYEIPSTTPQPPEKQIEVYLTTMKRLSAADQDSLQIAVNVTSVLLTQFHESSDPTSEANLLTATQQLETFATEYAMKHLKTSGSSDSTRTTNEKYFVMTLQKINTDHQEDVTFPSDDNGSVRPSERKEQIVLPSELFERKAPETVMIGIIYKDVHKLLPDESHVYLDGKTMENARLGTRVIACSIRPRPLGVLQENVTISFTLETASNDEDKPHCVFWDFQEKSRFNGSWSSKGCSLVKKTGIKVVCTCNHLTNFAVLMQIGEKKIPAKHQAALEVITYIGCGLSLFGELLTVITYLVFMNLKQEQSQIRLNLVVAIAIAQIIFLAGIDATARKAACIFVAVSIHYFYLAGFAWMLMEGIYLYLMVVKVFNTIVKMKLFYAFSWGFPCLMVVLSLVIASKTDDGIMSYVHSDFCWVSFYNNLVWTFAAPVLLVCLINLVILCRVVCEMTKMQAAKDISNVKQGLKACVVLFPLLGMTWVFGVLSVTEAGLAFQYIFTILNSLQGFFIFIIHVLRSSEVRAAFLRKKQKWETAKNSNFPSSRSVMDGSNDSSEKYPIGNMRGATSSPDPLFRRHQVSPINSDTMNTRLSCITPVDS